MSTSLHIATVSADAAPRLASLHGTLFPDAPWSENDFTDMLAIDGTIAAIATYDNRDVGLLLLRCLYETAEILTIGVIAGHRQSGIGGLIIDFSQKAATENKANELFLEVAEDNDPALRLYTAKGFIPISRRPGYYRHRGRPVAALVMRLNIKEF